MSCRRESFVWRALSALDATKRNCSHKMRTPIIKLRCLTVSHLLSLGKGRKRTCTCTCNHRDTCTGNRILLLVLSMAWHVHASLVQSRVDGILHEAYVASCDIATVQGSERMVRKLPAELHNMKQSSGFSRFGVVTHMFSSFSPISRLCASHSKNIPHSSY